MAFALQSRGLAAGVAPARASRVRSVVVRAALELKSPPYALDALEPHMSKQTLEFHWGALPPTNQHRTARQAINTTIYLDLYVIDSLDLPMRAALRCSLD